MTALQRLVLLANAVCAAAQTTVCPSGNPSDGLAVDVLRGAHLRVSEMEWPPYATKDSSAPHGWTGFDIELFSAVADILGFTFEIDEPAMISGETYTQMLLRTVEHTDLWLSWWLRTQERMDGSTMLLGHVDSSPVLISPPPQPSAGYALDTFFQPFTYPLWGLIIVMVACSGLVDYFLERGYGGSLQSSIYEYFGGVLWGGFQDPHTRLSAVFQVFNALIVMILVAAYTANLASFMTISNAPKIGFSSVSDLVAQKTSVCSVGSYGEQSTLETIFSDVVFDTSVGGYSAIGNGLVGGQCKAAILPKVDFDTLVNDADNCQLSVVGASLYFSVAGWVTNLNSSLCIQRPIEYALHRLQGNGRLNEIFQQWMPVAACESGTSRRRLKEVQGGVAAPSTASAVRAHQPSRRRLVGTGGVAAAAAGGEDDDGLVRMTPEQFLGVFILWGVVAVSVLAVKLGIDLYKHMVSSKAVMPSSKKNDDDKPDPLQLPGEGSMYPEGLDINNPSAMLRYLILHMPKAEQATKEVNGDLVLSSP